MTKLAPWPAVVPAAERDRLAGRPAGESDFSGEFDRRVKRLGLPRFRLHDLRHTWAIFAPQAGIHPKGVSERLGHSTNREHRCRRLMTFPAVFAQAIRAYRSL